MSTDEQAIRALIDEWHRATATGDVDTILTLMDEDVVFLVPGQPPIEGRRAFEEQMRDVFATHRIDSSGDVQEVEVSGNIAYCWNQLRVRMAPISGGEANQRSGNVLSSFPQASQWLMGIAA